MLRVMYGPMEGATYNTAVYFRNVYQDDRLSGGRAADTD